MLLESEKIFFRTNDSKVSKFNIKSQYILFKFSQEKKKEKVLKSQKYLSWYLWQIVYLHLSFTHTHYLHTVMELDMYYKVIGSLVVIAVVVIGWRILNWVWLRPKKLEKILRNQGFKGSSYRLLYGDLKQVAAARKQARSKPINLHDDFLLRATPTSYTAISQHGKHFFTFSTYLMHS